MTVITTWRKGLVLGAVAASSLLLAACGDSGSSGDGGGVSASPVTYTGVTTAAAVDSEAAAVKFSAMAVSGNLPSSSGLLTGVSTGSAGGAPFVERLRSLADMVMGQDYTPLASVTLAAGATASNVEQGCSGTASGTITYDDIDNSGTFNEVDRLLSASSTYSNFKPRNNDGSCSSLTFNGTDAITFLYENPLDQTMLTGIAMSTPALASTDATGATETMTGSLTISMLSSGFSFTLSADYRDASGAVYRAKDYKIEISYLYGVTSVDGILCDPAEGCIEIVTTPVFSYDNTCSYPISGVLTIYGYDLDAASRTSGYITVDAGADAGGCDSFQVCWNDGVTSACVVPDPMW